VPVCIEYFPSPIPLPPHCYRRFIITPPPPNSLKSVFFPQSDGPNFGPKNNAGMSSHVMNSCTGIPPSAKQHGLLYRYADIDWQSTH